MNLSSDQSDALFATLAARFEANPQRHPGISWADVTAQLNAAAPAKLTALHQLEATGGEPDVVKVDAANGELTFMDCSPESPAGRTALCYDQAGWASRKAHQPAGNVIDTAAAMGVELLTEADYHHLQSLGAFDQKTSSWLATPADVRERGGALFGDRRYGRVFIYHNGAQSYYSARGFRALLRV
ncbi:DUF4256 domain-containing protein [Actomonas aquatica]|uniref:DUF4256 domain-containing protein n=1 Tax=Actomonas aquatica TaxID=2866162 RepID=A0ABZ1CBZ4_9BACT|nr:DUF4256 domain-containing protein [Opitutus sp. WL0086]WRQ89187.1 DUF4256 domain-containing protein [Opitutus sp. WL0086]